MRPSESPSAVRAFLRPPRLRRGRVRARLSRLALAATASLGTVHAAPYPSAVDLDVPRPGLVGTLELTLEGRSVDTADRCILVHLDGDGRSDRFIAFDGFEPEGATFERERCGTLYLLPSSLVSGDALSDADLERGVRYAGFEKFERDPDDRPVGIASSLATIGDVDGDGFADVATDSFILYGAADGLPLARDGASVPAGAGRP